MKFFNYKTEKNDNEYLLSLRLINFIIKDKCGININNNQVKHISNININDNHIIVSLINYKSS
jgi:hypothetical protein